MSKVAVVGNREGWNRNYIIDKMKKYINPGDIIITGGADGVDTFAMDFAKYFGHQLIVFYPDPKLPSPERYYKRNKKIAEECNVMRAFNKKEHSGTSNAIRYVRELGKQCYVYGGDKH